MIRVFKVTDNGYTEVESNGRLSGIIDAIKLSESSGDGKYAVDYGNNQYQVLNISDGLVQQFNAHSLQSGSPAEEYDGSSTESTSGGMETGSFSSFGTILATDDSVGLPIDGTQPAVEEF